MVDAGTSGINQDLNRGEAKLVAVARTSFLIFKIGPTGGKINAGACEYAIMCWPSQVILTREVSQVTLPFQAPFPTPQPIPEADGSQSFDCLSGGSRNHG
jgi:hypothetical protein